MGWGCAGGGSWPSNLRADSHLCTWMLGVPPLQHPWRVGKEGGGEGRGVEGWPSWGGRMREGGRGEKKK